MRFYLKGKNPNLFDKALQDSKNTAKENAKIIKAKQTKENIKEHSLHPLLVKFLYENPNFKEFIQTINEDLEIGKRHRISKNRYDIILDNEAIQKHMEANKFNL